MSKIAVRVILGEDPLYDAYYFFDTPKEAVRWRCDLIKHCGYSEDDFIIMTLGENVK